MKCGFLVWLAYLALLPQLRAQELELFNLHSFYLPLWADGEPANLVGSEISIRYPLVNKEKTRGVLVGVKGSRHEATGLLYVPSPPLYAIRFELAYIKRISKEAAWSVFVFPELGSDFTSLGSDALRYTLGGRYKFKVSEKLRLGVGLVYSRQFFGHVIFPIAEVDWRISKKLRLSGPLPLSPRLQYSLSKRYTLGAQFKVQVSSFRLGNEEGNKILHYDYRSANLFLSRSLGSHWYLTAALGFTPRMQARLYPEQLETNWSLLTIPIGRSPQPEQRSRAPGFLFALDLKFALGE